MSYSLPQPTARNRRAALTVLELVSALALLVIILGTLMVALNSATDIWSRSASKNRAQQNVRRALELLATDLASAVAQASLPPDDKLLSRRDSASDTDELFFIAENPASAEETAAAGPNLKSGLYFVRQRSPLEISGDHEQSLELIAYQCFSTNGLARYTRPVVTSTDGSIEPSVSKQLIGFRNDLKNAVSNTLSSSVIRFVPYVFQPRKEANPSEDKPIEPLNKDADLMKLVDLPDYVDVHIAYEDSQDASSVFSQTNYLTRRITLPAAQASRLP